MQPEHLIYIVYTHVPSIVFFRRFIEDIVKELLISDQSAQVSDLHVKFEFKKLSKFIQKFSHRE